MRAFVGVVAIVGALFAGGASAGARPRTAGHVLTVALRRDVAVARHTSGALVVDLSTGRTLYSLSAMTPRVPASVEKLYTTSTALLRLGPDTRFTTSVLGVGSFDLAGGWHGTLYLRGGGDPTFGSGTFDRFAYGTGATMQQLVAHLIAATGIRSLDGAIVGDESYFDSLRGTAPYGYRASTEVEGVLSALAYDRGFAAESGAAYQTHPARFAAEQFATALRAAGVIVPASTPIGASPTPPGAQTLAAVHSPRLAWLIRLTNSPSDNFFAEMLLKGLGAAFGGAGTTAAGAAVVRAQMQTSFHIAPALEDGSGLSRSDATSPLDVVTVLRALANNGDFVNSLSVAGRTGTMQIGLRATAAQDRCRGKTGTLVDVANLVGYCTARDGHVLVFAFLMNAVAPVAGHRAENRMAVALANYDG